MTYENLLDECNQLGIKVKEVILKSSDGLCKGNRIAINKSLKTNNEKKCILAEELGHYKLTVGDITDQSKTENVKQELIARRWSYTKLVGFDKLIEAHKSYIKEHELAEYLGVTEQFLHEAIEYYKSKYGLWYEIDNYIIRFEPLGIIEKFEDF